MKPNSDTTGQPHETPPDEIASGDTKPSIDAETDAGMSLEKEASFTTDEIMSRMTSANLMALPGVKELRKNGANLSPEEFIQKLEEALRQDPDVADIPWKDEWIAGSLRDVLSEIGPRILVASTEKGLVFINPDDLIGSGGQGSVSGVHHSQEPDTDAVIKITPALTSELPGVGDIRSRFERETGVLSELKEVVGVPQLVDNGVVSHPHRIFSVQERIVGVELESILMQAGKLPPDAVKVVLIRTATVMKEVADRGILHRDIKASNISIRAQDGQPFVLDFGLASHKERNMQESITRTQVGLGSPGYMAAEQMDPKHAMEEATDISQMGKLAYYLLRGQTFMKTAEERRMLIGYQQKDDDGRIPAEFDIDVHARLKTLWKEDAELAAVLELMLQSNKADRYQSWDQLLHDGGLLTYNTEDGVVSVEAKPLSEIVSEELTAKWPVLSDDEMHSVQTQDGRARLLNTKLRKAYGGALSASDVNPDQITNVSIEPTFDQPTHITIEGGSSKPSLEKKSSIRNRVLGISAAVGLGVATLMYATKKESPSVETPDNTPTPTAPDNTEQTQAPEMPKGAALYPGLKEMRITRKPGLPNYTYGVADGDWLIWHNEDVLAAHENHERGELLYIHFNRFNEDATDVQLGYLSGGARSFGKGDTHAVTVPMDVYKIRDFQKEVGTDDTDYPEDGSQFVLVNIGDHVLMFVEGEEGYVYFNTHREAYKDPHSALVFKDLEDYRSFLESKGVLSELETSRDVFNTNVRGTGSSEKFDKGGAKFFKIKNKPVPEGEEVAAAKLQHALDEIIGSSDPE